LMYISASGAKFLNNWIFWS